MATELPVAISVVYCSAPHVVQEVALVLSPGDTVRQAIAASGLLVGLSEAEVAALECGVWGRKVALSHLVRDGDRVELYRPLRVDPKEARRQRFSGQGTKVAGLFRRRRPGAKSGY